MMVAIEVNVALWAMIGCAVAEFCTSRTATWLY